MGLLGRKASSVSPLTETAGSAGNAAGSGGNSSSASANKKQAYEHSKPGTIWHALSFKDENDDEQYEDFCDMVEAKRASPRPRSTPTRPANASSSAMPPAPRCCTSPC